jgi:integrase/recombinase XerD
LVRTPVTLPKVLSPGDVDRLVAALRTERDRAMVDAMLLGGLRRCEVLGLRLEDVRSAERKVFIADGKGGRQRLIPMSARFFTTLARYLDQERPTDASTDAVFVVLRGPTTGAPLSAFGLDEIMRGARRRAGLAQASCHQLRHTCFTRLREAGMSIEALASPGRSRLDRDDAGVSAPDERLARQRVSQGADLIDAANAECLK